MKKLSLIFIMAIAAFSSYAQSSFKEDVDVLQSVYGKSKADLVKQYMNYLIHNQQLLQRFMMIMKHSVKLWDKVNFN
jgi:hypothetical protein